MKNNIDDLDLNSIQISKLIKVVRLQYPDAGDITVDDNGDMNLFYSKEEIDPFHTITADEFKEILKDEPDMLDELLSAQSDSYASDDDDYDSYSMDDNGYIQFDETDEEY